MVQKLLSSLSDEEVTAVNRALIESAFSDVLHRHPGLVFQTYYAYWLKRLLDIRLTDDDGYCAADDWSGEDPPCGFLVQHEPDKQRADIYGIAGYTVMDASGANQVILTSEYQRNLARFISPPLVFFPGAPVHMSSGFHQVAPIIVQAGLMKKNEVMCIENPEVHLHPRLQLDIAEFLVRQASIGKYMIVETHSDLVVRRVMRAVLEEELKQEAVRLYFARMDTTSEQYGGRRSRTPCWNPSRSTSGRIKNWPRGFMDDDIRESRRLIDIMYGSSSDPGDDADAAG